MSKVYLGANMSMPVRPAMRKKAEEFFEQVLGAKKSFYDDVYSCYHLANGYVIGITSRSDAPTEEDYEKSMWLELLAEDFDATKKKAQDFGVRQVNGGMMDAYFFNIPGGPVVRLVDAKMLEKEQKRMDEKQSQPMAN